MLPKQKPKKKNSSKKEINQTTSASFKLCLRIETLEVEILTEDSDPKEDLRHYSVHMKHQLIKPADSEDKPLNSLLFSPRFSFSLHLFPSLSPPFPHTPFFLPGRPLRFSTEEMVNAADTIFISGSMMCSRIYFQSLSSTLVAPPFSSPSFLSFSLSN